MPCKPTPKAEDALIPAGMKIPPPGFNGQASLADNQDACCKIPAFQPPPIPVAAPAPPPAVMAAIRDAIDAVQSFLDGKLMPCPRE